MEKIPIIIGSMGLLMDLISLVALISTLFGKKSSGFLFVGFTFYILAIIVGLFTDKRQIPVLLGLVVFHFAVNVPMIKINRSR